MKTVSVSASRRYEILIERGLLRRAGELVRGVTNAGTVMLVSDDSVWPLYGETVQKSLAERRFFRVPVRVSARGELQVREDVSGASRTRCAKTG